MTPSLEEPNTATNSPLILSPPPPHIPTPQEFREKYNHRAPKIVYYYDEIRQRHQMLKEQQQQQQQHEEEGEKNMHHQQGKEKEEASSANEEKPTESHASQFPYLKEVPTRRSTIHLQDFISRPFILENLLNLYRFLNKNHLNKEISEAGAMMQRLRQILSVPDEKQVTKDDEEPLDQSKYVLFDIGSGKGFIAVWCHLDFPKVHKILLLDRASNIKMEHLQYFEKARFRQVYLRTVKKAHKNRGRHLEMSLNDLLEEELLKGGEGPKMDILPKKMPLHPKKKRKLMKTVAAKEVPSQIPDIAASNAATGCAHSEETPSSSSIASAIKLPYRGIIFGCHLCTYLSEILIESFNMLETIHGFVLSPCCHIFHEGTNDLFENDLAKYYQIVDDCIQKGYMDESLREEFTTIEYNTKGSSTTMDITSQYKVWTMHLFRLIEDPEKCDILRIERDPYVLSEKHYFISARKAKEYRV